MIVSYFAGFVDSLHGNVKTRVQIEFSHFFSKMLIDYEYFNVENW